MARRKLVGKRVLLTGASSGIGRALAESLVAAGAHVLAVARREDKLAEIGRSVAQSQGRYAFLAADVTDAAARRSALDRVQSEFGGLDILVNNAGIGARGRFESAGPERLRRIMEVNFFAAVELTRAALPTLTAGAQPIIVNVGSILGHRGIPRMSEYCASKFALVGFSQSLRAELVRQGVDLLLVSPGTTNTQFFEHALDYEAAPWPEQRGVSPELVAKRTLSALKAGRHEVFVNPRGRLLVLANRIAPAVVDRFLARYG